MEDTKVGPDTTQKPNWNPVDMLIEMAITGRETKWFEDYSSEGPMSPPQIKTNVENFNKKHNLDLSPQQAQELENKRVRYLLGMQIAYLKGERDPREIKERGKSFEKLNRERNRRIQEWRKQNADRKPRVKTKSPVNFDPGSYYNECIEKIPSCFKSTDCRQITEGTELIVTGYDPVEKFIQLDFPDSIREQIITEDDASKVKYVIMIQRDKLENDLEFLDEIE